MEQDALTSAARPSRQQQALSALRQPAVWLALAALALLAWQWIDSRARMAELQQEVARRLAGGDAAAGEARALARQNQEALAALQAKTGALEAKLAESQSQQAALDAMVQELTRNRDERLLAETEAALNAAAQQLQLAGNVEAALLALQGADARLAAAGRAPLLPLRKVIARDIERLKAQPLADVPGIALRIESVVGGRGCPAAGLRGQAAGRACEGLLQAGRAARLLGEAAGRTVAGAAEPGPHRTARPARSGPALAEPRLLPAREPQAAAG
jgi:uroporphyrin-3 C-methyltransferase